MSRPTADEGTLVSVGPVEAGADYRTVTGMARAFDSSRLGSVTVTRPAS